MKILQEAGKWARLGSVIHPYVLLFHVLVANDEAEGQTGIKSSNCYVVEDGLEHLELLLLCSKGWDFRPVLSCPLSSLAAKPGPSTGLKSAQGGVVFIIQYETCVNGFYTDGCDLEKSSYVQNNVFLNFLEINSFAPRLVEYVGMDLQKRRAEACAN